MSSLRMIVFAAAVLAAAPASAQMVLSGGTVHVGNGDVIEGGVVVIGADGKIAAVGKNVAAPANAELVDVTGKIVTPGLIDVSTQLGLVEIWAVERSRDGDGGALDGELDVIRAAFRAVDAFNPMAVAIPETRVNGVTSVVALPSGGLISGQGAYVELLSEFGHARVVDDFVAMSAVLGARGGQLVGGSRGGAILRLREALDDAKFWRDNKAKYDDNRSRVLAQSRLDSAALVEVLDGKPLVVAVDRAADILATLALARETKINVVIAGADEGWMVAKELASAKVPVIVRPMENLPTSFDSLGTRADNAALMHSAGVRVVLSTFDTHNVRNLRYLAGNAVRDGMKHDAALQAVTRNAAEAMALGDSVGTLEPGKAGNVVVWSADPFEISTQVEGVWIRGQKVPKDTRQNALFERYRDLKRHGPVPAPLEPPLEVPADTPGEDDGAKQPDVQGGQNVE